MPNFLYSATDANGKPVQGFIEGAGSRHAFDALQAQGMADIKLHQEAAFASKEPEIAGLTKAQVSELARLRLDAMRSPGLWPLLKSVARINRKWLSIDALLFASGIYLGSTTMMVLAAIAATFPFAWAAWHYRHGDRYVELIKSYSIGDWSRVQFLADNLNSRVATVPTLGFDLAIRLACIRAHQGQLDEAVAGLEPWRHKPEVIGNQGMFECRVAAVYAAHGDRMSFLRLMGEAYEVSNHDPSRTMDFALATARFGDADQAERLMAQVDLQLLPPFATGFIAWTKGLLALRRSQADAVSLLGDAVAEFLKMAQQPGTWTALAFCTVDHAIALNLAGNRSEARRELAQVWPIVRAHADQPLLKLLKADGLVPAPIDLAD